MLFTDLSRRVLGLSICLVLGACSTLPQLGGSASDGAANGQGAGGSNSAAAIDGETAVASREKAGTNGESISAFGSGSGSGSASGSAAGPEKTVTADPYLSQAPNVSTTAERLFQEALISFQSGDWSVAERQFKHLSENYPSLSGPWLNLGILARRDERQEAARTYFKQAAKANPRNLAAYNHLAISHREAGEFEEAEQWYLQALNVWPDHADSHRNIGILYELYMGRLAAALPHYQRAYELAPDRQLKGWLADTRRRLDAGQ